jgi:hypothetical protein
MPFAGVGGTSVRDGQYLIDNSLRFNDDDNAYLSKTLSASPTNQKIVSFSFWAKRGNLGVYSYNLVGNTSAPYVVIGFINDDTFSFQLNAGSGSTGLITTAKYRDTSAYYHMLCVLDTTQATSSNRLKIYINGIQITDFGTANYPTQDSNWNINTNVEHGIGGSSAIQDFDGYMAEVHFIDGQALSPTDFGEFDEDSGIWKPIEYSGSYGTNGFYLDFENSGSLGADQSGNGNDFTPTNLASTDQTTDTPTNNFCTLNPLMKSTTNVVLTQGNLNMVSNFASGWQHSGSTFAVKSGKWYWEAKATVVSATDKTSIGVVQFDTTQVNFVGNTNLDLSAFGISGHGAGTGSYTYAQGDIILCAMDLDNNKVYWGKNGTYFGTLDPAAGTGATTQTIDNNNFCMPIVGGYNGSTWELNFGFPQFTVSSGNADDNGYGNFEYAPPSGYLALCTQNLATELSPTIDDGSQYFNTVLYTGNGVDDRSITGVGFQPDFLWIKERDQTRTHLLQDSTRGATKYLGSNTTSAETTNANGVQAFESDGFQLGTDSDVNLNTGTYVAWQWKANAGSTSSNTDGDITSTVQANTTAGFSIVQFTKTGDDQAVGHGLGKKPKLIIIKPTNTTGNWIVMPEIDGVMSNKYLLLNGTDALGTDGSYAEPTSSVFYVSNQVAGNNTHIGYVFTDIEGYSKFGKYTGNGSSDGTFVYTGFRPAWILIKRTNTTENWIIADNKRDTYNVMDKILFPNTSGAENTGNAAYDFLSNGFKFRNTSQNESGATYIYMAFAENPFVSSTAIPVTAR